MPKRITLSIYNDIPPDVALRMLAAWYEKCPGEMRGITTFTNDCLIYKREYTKGDCFVVQKEKGE